ncbi:MAG: sigma-70 family RNA polymerase sigma factor [Terriglobia bacterium]|jgi:RNA polymerase sigma-70 factor
MTELNFGAFFANSRQRLTELHVLSGAPAWAVSLEDFSRAVWEGIQPALAQHAGSVPDLLKKIRAEELALALACAQGNDRAWEAFSFGYRNAVYEAACAFTSDITAGRELSDSLTAELYGLEAENGARISKLSYYHGRSSLKTWLRAVVYQKFVDEYRERMRLEPLPDDLPAAATERASSGQDEERYARMLGEAVTAALSEVPPAHKLLLSLYYIQRLTLRQIGRITGEHEATVSRHMDGLRKKMRKRIEDYLRKTKKLSAYEIERCLNFDSRGALFNLDKELKSEE